MSTKPIISDLACGRDRLGVLLAAFFFILGVGRSHGFEIPPDTKQLVVGVSPSWDASVATLQLWERREAGERWRKSGRTWQVRLGSKGLAWGRGIHAVPPGSAAPVKREGDGRAPAGVFELGNAYGYAPDIRRDPSLTYHQITEADLWVEDPTSRYYNQHLRLKNRQPISDWEHRAQMKLGDSAHALKLFIGHNAPPHTVAGAGSAIFFHIWRREGMAATSGCTVMDQERLENLISWVRPAARPLYVLLPAGEYAALRGAWKLP